MFKIYLVKGMCFFLPPIVAQRFRHLFIDLSDGAKRAFSFKRKMFTGGFLYGNTKDFHAFKVFFHGYFDWRNIILAKHIMKFQEGAIVEVGANVGTETISLADIAKKQHVHAFEPVPFNFEYLKQIKTKNKASNLHIYNEAVSDKEGSLLFHEPEVKHSGSGFLTNTATEKTIEVATVTLDDKLKAISALSSILIDVEGFEYQVLEGATTLVDRFRPFIILEANANYLEKRGGVSLKQLHDLLIDKGYQLFYIKALGLRSIDMAHFEVNANKNWLCIPKEHHAIAKKMNKCILLNAFNPFFQWFTF